jgi:hypothetical protein
MTWLYIPADLCALQRFVFPFINICATKNTSPALPVYLSDIVKMLIEWQVGVLDDDGLFRKFWTHKFDLSGDLMASYRVVKVYQYSWWKDQFDLTPFEMPSCITPDEVRDLYQHHGQQTVILV